MKTKRLIIVITACLFAAGSIINMHLAQNYHKMDISLADISVMAQAGGEFEVGELCYQMETYICYWKFGDDWGDTWILEDWIVWQ